MSELAIVSPSDYKGFKAELKKPAPEEESQTLAGCFLEEHFRHNHSLL
jgi:hypothetical protein